MLENEIETKELLIKEFLQKGEILNAKKISAEMHELQKKDYRQRLKMFKLQVNNYMKANNVDFRGFCQNFGLNVYYTKKIFDGLIEPSKDYLKELNEKIVC